MATNIVDGGLNIIGSNTGTQIVSTETYKIRKSVEVSASTDGATSSYLVLADTAGTRFKITVSSAGVISATSSGSF